MTNWVTVGPTDTFPPGEHVCTEAAGEHIVVFNHDGAFFVLANICPHAGLPLGEGDRTGKIITCPFHGYAYNIENGKNIDWPDEEAPVRTYATRVEDGQLQIQMEE